MTLVKSLYLYAKGNAERTATLESMLDEAFSAIADGKGEQVTSTSTNGVSITFGSKSMTNAEWFGVLTEALQMIDKGVTGSKSQGVLR